MEGMFMGIILAISILPWAFFGYAIARLLTSVEDLKECIENLTNTVERMANRMDRLK